MTSSLPAPDDMPQAEPSGHGPLHLDVRKYQGYLAEFDLSETQQIEMLETLWSMMSSFVELGFAREGAVPDELLKAAPAVTHEPASTPLQK